MMLNESATQCEAVALFRAFWPNLAPLFFAVPNGSTRNPIEASRLKREGVVAGVADMLLLVPRGGFHGLAVEFKAQSLTYGKGGRLIRKKTYQKPHQREWQEAVEAQGYKYVVVRSSTEFIQIMRNYLTNI